MWPGTGLSDVKERWFLICFFIAWERTHFLSDYTAICIDRDDDVSSCTNSFTNCTLNYAKVVSGFRLTVHLCVIGKCHSIHRHSPFVTIRIRILQVFIIINMAGIFNINRAGITMPVMESKKSLTTEQLEDASRLKALYESKKKELKITQYTIADDLGVTQGAIGHFLNGRNALNVDVAAGFAKALQVSVSDFSPSLAAKIASQAESLSDNVAEYMGRMKAGAVPVVGEAILGVDGMIDMVEIRAGWLQIYSPDKDAYGLKVKGDSMHPRIQSGEFVVIEPNTKVHSGDEVFVRTTDGHNMIKIMTKTRDGSYQFSSINNEHKPITLDPNEVQVMHFVSAIVKATRYTDYDEVPPRSINGLNISN